jgi:hypothetical protein
MAEQLGLLQLAVDGVVYNAKGSFSYNLGQERREGVVGADRVHGYKVTPQVPFIEGEITDRSDLDLKALLTLRAGSVSLTLRNGKVIMLRDAYFAGEGTVGS